MNAHPGSIKFQIPTETTRYKSYSQIILIVVNLSLSNLYFGYCLVYISTIDFNEVIEIFSISLESSTAKGILTGCIPVGAGIGALLGLKLIHVFSRRNFVLFINLIAIMAGSLIYITNFGVLICMRVIQGICVGLYTSIIPTYITEITPVQLQSSTGTFTQIFCSLGAALAYLLYLILSQILNPADDSELIWYLVIGFPLLTLIIQSVVLLFVFPYQTPKYYLMHHQKKQAKQLIRLIYRHDYVETVYHEKVQDLQFIKCKQIVKEKIDRQRKASVGPVPTIRMASKISVNSEQLNGVQIEEPQTPAAAIFAAIHLMILRQFSGINAVVAYGGDIISQTNQSMRSIVPVFLNFQVALGSIVAICVLRKLGKKTMLQAGTIILALSLILITIGFFLIGIHGSLSMVLILIGLIIYMFTFGLTYGAIIWAYVAEIVEPSYTILATLITWIFASIVIILFPILKTSLLSGSPTGLFLFFGVWMIVSYFVNIKFLVQTNRKTEHQIHEEYSKISCSTCFLKNSQIQEAKIEKSPDLSIIIKLPKEIEYKVQSKYQFFDKTTAQIATKQTLDEESKESGQINENQQQKQQN